MLHVFVVVSKRRLRHGGMLHCTRSRNISRRVRPVYWPVSTVRDCSLRMPRGECSALPRTVDTGVARYEAFARVLVGFRAVLKSAELFVKWIRELMPRTVKGTILLCKPTNLHNETFIMVNHEMIRQLGSINVIKCSKSCLDIRKKFGKSSSNHTSSRSPIFEPISKNFFDPPTGFTMLAKELTLRQMARGIRSEQPRTVDTGFMLCDITVELAKVSVHRLQDSDIRQSHDTLQQACNIATLTHN
ncbi:hypothetical protein J6590_103742 [Homalodisca vitripennis]|nr:hypothetical protein J6590_103742 [Homalodisca vitripennis]